MSWLNEVQDESSESKTEPSEDEPKKLKDVIKNEKDQTTFDILSKIGIPTEILEPFFKRTLTIR